MSMNVTVTLNDDRQTAEAKFGENESVKLSADDVMSLLNILGAVREQMLPEFPQTPEGHPFGHLGRPGWWVFDAKIENSRTLAVRHPAFGWIGVGFSDEDAARLAGLITASMKEPTTAATGTA